MRTAHVPFESPTPCTGQTILHLRLLLPVLVPVQTTSNVAEKKPTTTAEWKEERRKKLCVCTKTILKSKCDPRRKEIKTCPTERGCGARRRHGGRHDARIMFKYCLPKLCTQGLKVGHRDRDFSPFFFSPRFSISVFLSGWRAAFTLSGMHVNECVCKGMACPVSCTEFMKFPRLVIAAIYAMLICWTIRLEPRTVGGWMRNLFG